ncbi:acyltransferase [Virgibacillus necropolis]|uniref:acyltransferase n=1 Tax=Virgibacillus necropolis TaxID=163877 RepID=UPI00384F0CE5
MERNYSIDFVKFFAIFFVVAIHTGTVSNVQLGNVDGEFVDFLIDIVARFAVPFFFITSGYLFMHKMNSIQNGEDVNVFKKQLSYLKRYTVKLVKLYIAWFIFYFIFELLVKFIETEKMGEALSSMTSGFISQFDILDIIYYGTDSPQYHLWFLLALIYSIIIIFIFMKLRLLKVLFVVSLGFHLYGMFGQSYSWIYEIPYDTSDALFFGLFYSSLGAIFAKYNELFNVLACKIFNIEYIGFLFVLSVAQIAEAFINIQLLGGQNQNYFISTIPLSILIFLFIIKYPAIGKNSFVSKIGANAVGIYVSHVFVIKAIRMFMEQFGLTAVTEQIIWQILFTPAVFIIAYFFYSGLKIQKLKCKEFLSRNVYQTT